MPTILARKYSLLRIDAAGMGVCVLASLIWYLTMGGPALDQRSATAGLRHEIRTQQGRASELRAAIAAVEEQLASVRQELAEGTIPLDSTARINRRIAGLTEFFSRCDLQVDDVQTGRPTIGRQCDVVPITIVGKGAYRQCVRFLHGLCSAFPDLGVMRIELAGNPAQSLEPEMFRLELFWYAAPSGLVPAAASEKPQGYAGTRS